MEAQPFLHCQIYNGYGIQHHDKYEKVESRWRLRTFGRFPGLLDAGDRVPDAKTIWLFREHLTQADAVENLETSIRRDFGCWQDMIWRR